MSSSLATTGRDVRIRTTPDQQQLPEWLRARLHLGARRAEQLRQDIAARAGLPTLPPVEIVPEVWRLDGDLILGRIGVVERDGDLHLGVLLPGPSAVQSDDDLLRAVLVRQFSDCISRLALAATKNTAVSTATHFFDPAVWFGPEGAFKVTNWKDRKILGMEILADFLSKSLPVVAPPPDTVVRDLAVPDWILARLESAVGCHSTPRGGRS